MNNIFRFGTSHDEGFWGTPDVFFDPFPSTVQYLQERGKNQITSVELTDQSVQDAFNGDFGVFEAIVVSEGVGEEPDERSIDLKAIANLSPQSYQLINQFVSGGGCLILTGDHGDGEDEFLNDAFGYNVTVVDADEEPPPDTFLIQLGAAGTQFEGGPPVLLSADASEVFSNTPGTTIYNGAEGVIVFTDQFVLGTVTVIGWDYCCTPPEEEGPILDWFEVVNRAFDQCEPPVSNVPTLSEWGLISMAGILGIVGFMVMRRRKVAA
ncbi:MAG: IPTL-CTERM sorting domain-containing protein [Thermodesulfobacteriota bacterium]